MTVCFREDDAIQLWRRVLDDHFTSQPAEQLRNATEAAEIMDRIAAANAGLRRVDQAIQAVHDSASMRVANRSEPPSLRCGMKP